MEKRKVWLGVLILAFVLGMAVLGTCGSSPRQVSEPVLPDENSAVVYFFGYRSGSVWDGETPIGEFEGLSFLNMPWKTTPGEHYFSANTFNWITMRTNLQANTTYYVQLVRLPNPVPFSQDMIAFRVLEQDAGEKTVKQSDTVTFDVEWREKFVKGKVFQELKEQLQKAMSDKSMEITLN
jgi:hypothetical protein